VEAVPAWNRSEVQQVLNPREVLAASGAEQAALHYRAAAAPAREVFPGRARRARRELRQGPRQRLRANGRCAWSALSSACLNFAILTLIGRPGWVRLLRGLWAAVGPACRLRSRRQPHQGRFLPGEFRPAAPGAAAALATNDRTGAGGAAGGGALTGPSRRIPSRVARFFGLSAYTASTSVSGFHAGQPCVQTCASEIT